MPTYGEIKDFCARISFAPTIHIVFKIVLVDLCPAFRLVLVFEWSYPLGGYLINDGRCMMLPSKDGCLTKVPKETKNPIFFQRKEEEAMDNFLDFGFGNYVALEDITNKNPIGPIFQGLWILYFNGTYSKNGVGIKVLIESPNSRMKNHAYKLDF